MGTKWKQDYIVAHGGILSWYVFSYLMYSFCKQVDALEA